MRTHADIVKDADPDNLAEKLGVSVHTARSWRQRDSIPSDQWKALADLGVTSLEELAEAAASRKAA